MQAWLLIFLIGIMTWATAVHAGQDPILVGALPGQPRPAVIVLHGGLGSGAIVQQVAGLDAALIRRGVMVIYPSAADDRWNDGLMAGPRDDVDYLDGMIDLYVTQRMIDPTRLYIIGMSNGGMMTQRMLCASRYHFAGAGVVVATHPNIGRCGRPRPTPLTIVWGSEDPFFPPDGEEGNLWHRRHKPESRAATAAFWARANGCAVTSPRPYIWPVASQGPVVETFDYRGCNAALRILQVQGMGHTWPGGSLARWYQRANPNPPGFDFNGLILKAWFGN